MEIILQGVSIEAFLVKVEEIVERKVVEGLKQTESDVWLSVTEACKVWRPAISRNTLKKWSELYDFPATRFGGQEKYLLSDILRKQKAIRKGAYNQHK